jgi:hypothetical protein
MSDLENEASGDVPVEIPEDNISSEAWFKFRREFRELKTKVLQKTQAKYGRFAEFTEAQDEHLKKITDSGLNAQEYAAYHFSIAGSTGPDYSPHCDFPGDLSITRFYEEFLERLNGND